MKFSFLIVLVTFTTLTAFACVKKSDQSHNNLASSNEINEVTDLKNGLVQVDCKFDPRKTSAPDRKEVTTVKLINQDKVCDPNSSNYMVSAEAQAAGLFKVNCKSGRSSFATMAKVNEGKMCGPMSFQCSCTLTDDSSIIGFSTDAAGIAVIAGSIEEANRAVRNSLCLKAVRLKNPFFSKELSSVSNVRCSELR